MPNPSFEEYSSCPDGISQIERATPWKNPTGASPDYFHACAGGSIGVPENTLGYQEPHSGSAYCGLYAYSKFSIVREYIQIELTESIIKGIEYKVGFWCNLVDKDKYAISTLGAYLSLDTVGRNDFNVINVVPQILNDPLYPLSDKENWVLIADTFVSLTGGEKYLTIGNFHPDGESDTTFLETGLFNYIYSYYYIDDVFVIPLDSVDSVDELKKIRTKLYPNPNDGNMYLDYTGLSSNTTFDIYDLMGRLVRSYPLQGETGKININEQGLPNGLYTYRILDTETIYKSGKVVIRE